MTASPKVKKEVLSVLKQYWKAYEEQDVNVILGITVPDEDAVFLGVDGGARLQGQSLRDYVSKSLGSESASNGNTWGYYSSDRQIRLSADGTVAWFDESLQHEQLGAGRASGVLVESGGNWKIAQYNRIASLPGVAVVAPIGGAGAAASNTVPAAAPQKPECKQLRHKTNKKGSC